MKQKYIMVKATEEYRNEVRKMAHKHEMNISQFIRYLIDKEKQDMRKEDEGNETDEMRRLCIL